MRRSNLLLPLLAVVSMLSSAPLYAASEVRGLRVWGGPEYTRTVVDLSRSVDYKLFTLSNPERVVIDIADATLPDDLAAPKINGMLSGIRTGTRDGGKVRVVLDLKAKSQPKSFLLQPTAEYGHRLVIDVPNAGQAAAKPSVRRISDVVKPNRDVLVAVDAGHGGEDPGSIGLKGTYEKDVVLAIAKLVKAELDAMPGFQAKLVRTGDYFIPVRKRPDKAREMRADLFVSIHADAFHDRSVRGGGVFILSNGRASSEAARWIADRQNRSDLVGGVSLDDKDDTLASVLLDLSQSASLEASQQAAERVHRSMSSFATMHKRHVEKASFGMLTSPDIPSMLVETAFISNPKEERQLKSKKWQKQMARAIANGVRNYFRELPPPGTWLAANKTPSTHEVTSGETLSGIAQRHGVSLARLRKANNITGDRLYVGAVLKIPTS